MYARFNDVPISPSISAQIRLPFTHGGHDLNSLASNVHASYGACLNYCASVHLQGQQFPSVTQYQRPARRYMRVVLRNLPSSLLSCIEATVVASGRARVFGTRVEWETGEHPVITGNGVWVRERGR